MADILRVLHVEDDTEFADLAASYLDRHYDAFQIDHVASPEAALDRLEGVGYDCIVSDYDMPERNGIDLLRAVRRDHPDLPFILFTGKGSEEVADEAITHGVSDYLQKGSGNEHFDLLAQRIRQLVERYRAQREAEASTAQLEEAYARIDLALEHTNSIVFEIDQDTGHVRRTGKFEEFFDTAPGDVPTFEDHLETVVHPDDRDQFRAFYEELLAGTRRSGTIEYRTNPELEEDRWIRDDVHLDRDEGIVLGLAQDITESKLQEHQREQIIERVTDAIVHVDADWRFELLNEQAEELYGTSECELLGRNFCDVFPEAKGTRFEDVYRRVMEDREPDSLLEYSEDLEGYFDIQIYPQDDGGLAFYFSDVTERLERERWLQRYGEMLEQLQETTQQLIGAADVGEATDIVLESIEEVLEFDVVGIWHPTDGDDRLVPAAISERGSEIVTEPPTYTPEEDSLSWHAFEENTSRLIRDTYDHPDRANPESPIHSEIIVPLGEYGLINIGATEPDAFTEQDLAIVDLWAETVTSAIGRLQREQELRDREAELTRERNRLENFAGIVSHDLRNPLGVAIGHLELLAEDVDSPHIEGIDNALDRMDELIDDVLRLSQSGRQVGEPETVRLDALVQTCWSNVRTDGASFQVEGNRAILADRGRLAQVFENLFRNATEHGGEDVTVRVGSLEEGFFVEDDGAGIPPDVREDVFEAGHSTTGEGTGLGLTIINEIVAAHGWEISVGQSREGGARFEVTGVEFVS